MKDLSKRAYWELALRIARGRAIALFVVAWSVLYWQAWAYLAVTLTGDLATTHYLIRRDPELLARRMKLGAGAEHDSNRKVVQVVVRLAVLAVLAVAALDHRFRWSHVSPVLCLLGDVVVAAGMTLIWLTFRANSFASSVVEVDSDQKVISTGPYALVRHPMYTGLIIMFWGSALALGSWWAMTGAVIFTLGLVVRLLEEEQFLARSLSGYEEYRGRVRHRLAPLVW